ncbi:tyrosine-type recombinase/integrase [Myxococcota bacterium]
MSVARYKTRNGVRWKVDEWLATPDGKLVRFRKRNIPTKEQAMALVAKVRAEAFEGRFFERHKECKLTVTQAWNKYEPVTKRDNDAWQTDKGRAEHLIRHLGKAKAAHLTLHDIDGYRDCRLTEKTCRGGAPSPATLDREIELLKRMLNYAVKCGWLPTNPIATAKLLRKPNVRRSVVDERQLAKLIEGAGELLRPILLAAYDTGMRKEEILDLRWSQVDLREGTIRLAPQDTKSEHARVIYLTTRVLEALRSIPRHIKSEHVFVNPRTEKKWKDIRKAFRSACKAAKLKGVWFHDLRRSFVTNARRRGVSESVVMKMSGHRTRNVFDRYNVISEDDLKDAVRRIEGGQTEPNKGKVTMSDQGAESRSQDMDKVGSRSRKRKRPHQLSTGEA